MIYAFGLQFLLSPVFFILWLWDYRKGGGSLVPFKQRMKYSILLFLVTDFILFCILLLENKTNFCSAMVDYGPRDLNFLLLINGVIGSLCGYVSILFDDNVLLALLCGVLAVIGMVFMLFRAFPSFFIFYVWFSKNRKIKIVSTILYVLWILITIGLCLEFPQMPNR